MDIISSNNGYIYIRQHLEYDNHNICKLGKTKNIPDRDSVYATSEYYRGTFQLVIEISSNQKYDDTFVEKLLKKYFTNYHMRKNGGSEFYDKKIIDEIVLFLEKTIIKFKVLSDDEIMDLIRTYRINNLNKVLNKYKFTFKFNELSKKQTLRNVLQDKYLIKIIDELNSYKKVFIKAPTGFGKTHIYYKTIKEMKFNRVLFLTPRLNLNIQMTEEKYTSYIKDLNYTIIHYSHLIGSAKKESIIEEYSAQVNSNKKIIMTSCYQSGNKLLELIKNYNMQFDVIIFDEAHFITGWNENKKENKEFLNNSDITKYRIFGSATPTEDIEIDPLTYGKIIEEVKIYELINNDILCNIETIIKSLDNQKKEYHNLKNLIIDSMIKYNKKKGIVYVNNCTNANALHTLIKKQKIIKSWIYTSETEESNIKLFEKCSDKCIVIAVGKISYGYDNDLIDFICLGDPRQSDIDIRQIIGRGLRWDKSTYSDKILHLLIPLYKDEFNNYSKNEALKNYMNYIIGECGQDIIFKSNGTACIENSDKDNNKQSGLYEGDNIPIEILNEYCTTGYNKYTDFLRFTKANKLYDELSYNKLKETQNWLVSLGEIQIKYPKFCFRHIHPFSINYYWNKQEAIDATYSAKDILIKKIGRDKYSELTHDQLIKKYNLIDNKIPNIDIDLYYPIN